MERITLADVARHVGVSPKTVSNVVNSTGRVSDDVRQQVLAAIRLLRYQPNLAARELRQGRADTIALALPDLREPYFAELAAHFVTAAERRGRTVLIRQTSGERDRELDVMESRDQPSVGTIVLSPLGLTADDVLARRNPTRLILLGEQAGTFGADGASHVVVANVDASRAAVEHLISRGRRRIAAIGVQRGGPNASSTLRATGYRRALTEAGIEVDPILMREVDQFSRTEGATAVRSLIETGTDFDALFCFNDTLAFGAMTALALGGRTIPDDVAVVGFDDVEEASFAIPALTTIGPGPRLISEEVFRLIDDGRASKDPVHQTLDYEVVVRSTS